MYTQKSFSLKQEEIDKKWWVIDATDVVVGRLATEVATLLRGKHKPTFTPNQECGDFVVITNCEKVKFTGKKWSDKKPLGTHNVKKDPNQIKLIINKIQKFFSKNNYNARVIYRTTQDAFGKESPDNLLPKKL